MSRDTREERRARRRARREERRMAGDQIGVAALIPNLFTTMNLAAGFYSIVLSGSGHYERAAVALIFAAVFDILDGRLARMAGATSRFGFEYDSIADTVSFGVAPAMLAFHAGKFTELGWTGWVLGFMFTAGAALRLARFNVTPQRYPGRFEGLPSPAAAGMVVATVLFVGFLREAGLYVSVPALLPAFGLAALGLLMVSPIPYHSGKEVRLHRPQTAAVITVFAAAVVLLKPGLTLFPLGVAYVLSGPIAWLRRRRRGTTLETLAEASARAESAATSQADDAHPGPPHSLH
ncbi:MAG: CDP-diacylglycerol--serine O-phosphatidyltransferase [Myxococcales bacterium]|nr:CDP-diacylglycerol--serine O-phosphatidyltransferase [Myxococcales bacterium]